MSTEDVFVKQVKANIHNWKHELIELEARSKQGGGSQEQSQVSAQRVIELKSQINAAEKQIEQFTSS